VADEEIRVLSREADSGGRCGMGIGVRDLVERLGRVPCGCGGAAVAPWEAAPVPECPCGGLGTRDLRLRVSIAVSLVALHGRSSWITHLQGLHSLDAEIKRIEAAMAYEADPQAENLAAWIALGPGPRWMTNPRDVVQGALSLAGAVRHMEAVQVVLGDEGRKTILASTAEVLLGAMGG